MAINRGADSQSAAPALMATHGGRVRTTVETSLDPAGTSEVAEKLEKPLPTVTAQNRRSCGTATYRAATVGSGPCSDFFSNLTSARTTGLPVLLLACIALAGAVSAQDRFPDAEEKEQVTTTCSACHALSRVAANHRTEAQWAQTIKVHEGRGLKLDPEDAKPIVRYLAAYFGPLVNLNTATAADMAGLPGVTKKMADAVVQHRERHGPFQNVDDVAAVDGFPAALLPKIRNRLSK